MVSSIGSLSRYLQFAYESLIIHAVCPFRLTPAASPYPTLSVVVEPEELNVDDVDGFFNKV